MNKNKGSFHMGDEINGFGQQVYWMADQIIMPPVSQENVRLTPNFNKYLQKLIYSIPVINDPNQMDPVMLKVLGAMTGVKQVIFSESADAGKSASGDTITFIEEDGTTKTASLSFQLASGIPADQSSLKITSSNNKTKSKNNKNKDGWYDDGHGCYMYYKDNERVYGEWIEENGKYYYIDKLGYMVIGWETIDGHKYYFKSSGEMVTHWRKIFGDWYFFDEIKGYMKTNKWIEYNGSYYYVDNLGHMVIGWKSIEGSKYYFNDLGEMVTGWKNIKGKWYYFDEDGKMATGEREILGRTYDFKSDGSKDGTFPPLYIIDDFYFPIPEDNSVYWENMNFAAQLMYLHQLYHGFISEKQKEYVSKKAILGCTYGTKLTRLDATKAADISYLTDGSPVLGCDDCKVGENIHSFLSCRAGVEGCKGMPYREKMKDGFQKCIPMVEESWKQDNDNTPRICRDNGYTYEYALKKDAILVCKYKGIIGILEVMEDESGGMGEELVTMSQMSSFGFSITKSELKKLNELLKTYKLTDKNSIMLFMATCGHESGKGTLLLEDGDEAYFQSNGYTGNTRGAGYLQTTGDDQLKFYSYIQKTPPINRAKDIADNYAWEAAIWEWTNHIKGSGVIMNEYAEMYGNGENIFLVIQYFINSYLDKIHYPHFDSDLSSIRKGMTYSYDFNQKWTDYKGKVFTGVLKINGRTYRLPVNHADRLINYNAAINIFK